MSLSRSEITVMLRAADRALPAFAATENQRWDSLSAVARDRRGVTLPLSRFQTCASTSPVTHRFRRQSRAPHAAAVHVLRHLCRQVHTHWLWHAARQEIVRWYLEQR